MLIYPAAGLISTVHPAIWWIVGNSLGGHANNICPAVMLTELQLYIKSKKEHPQKLTQLSSRSHPRHLVGKRTAQKDTIIDITSDSQVNSNFPYLSTSCQSGSRVIRVFSDVEKPRISNRVNKFYLHCRRGNSHFEP